MSWPMRPFGEIAGFRNGVNYTAEDRQTGIGLFNVKDFQDRARPDYEGLEHVSSSVVSAKALLQQGDILFVRSNGNKELIGRSFFLSVPPPVPVSHSAFTIRARIFASDCHPQFYALYCRSGAIRRALSNQGSGTNISNLNQDILARLPVPILPLPMQIRIADILSAYDDLIENNTRRIAILEDMARRLFEEWFGQGAEVRWPTVKLGTLAAINPESIKPKSPPAEIGYIDIASVSPGKVDQVQWMDFADAPGRARRIVRNGDVIWSNVRPNRRSFALLLDVEQNTIASTGFSVLRAEAVPWSFLYVATTTSDFTAYLTNRAKGSAYPAVGSEDFADADVLQPDTETLDQFHNHVGPMLELAARLNAQSSNLRTTRDLLLPKLISGEIEVRAAEEELEAAAA